MKHGNKDLLVHSNGTIEHMVIMNTVVGCEVKLYNYPFASDFCAIALNVWAISVIILADVGSFALPLGESKHIPFKVKLVLSVIMFLNILKDLLPGGGQCSPIIRKHFCFCLVILVLSTLQSMVLTRLAKCGTLWPCSLSKSKDSLLKDTDNEEGKLFHSSVISVTHRAKYIFMVSKEDVNKPPY
ncbi:5-hydroxytryptamine receptor 3C-like isoform X2 [Salmo salar]|uniref:5-hydroxytryptamine receptor 3C-like isoform X2 n=1 Tax=Salmo salar TaxID=8030 RepID=A0ABM3EXJ4_SALSA|nr:5-hydroxytryptamine receptor 3C-like isoform X2 [Salmo salar]